MKILARTILIIKKKFDDLSREILTTKSKNAFNFSFYCYYFFNKRKNKLHLILC
jgi:hypothetical protein